MRHDAGVCSVCELAEEECYNGRVPGQPLDEEEKWEICDAPVSLNNCHRVRSVGSLTGSKCAASTDPCVLL